MVPFDRIKFHMVHFIPKPRSALEMKAVPTLFYAFVYRKYFKWLDS